MRAKSTQAMRFWADWTEWRWCAQIVGVGLFLLGFGWVPGRAQPQTGSVQVAFSERLGALEMDHMALGQGGLSDQPMWANRVPEIRALRPRLIRLFIQEYFDLMPEPDRYHFDSLDR